MKKQNKTPFILFLTAFIVVSVLSISAYTGVFKKDGLAKDNPPKFPPIVKTGGGPLQITTSLDNEYYFDNNSVYLYIDLRQIRLVTIKKEVP